jgi:hypothetical protein
MSEQFKLSKEQIEAIEKMINNVISTVEGSDDIELKIIDNEEWEAVLYVGVDSAYRQFGDIEFNDP